MYQKFFYITKAAFETDLNAGLVPYTAIVFVQKPAVIWTHGTYYTGGGGGATPIDISSTPIYYYKPTERSPISYDLSDYTQVTTLSGASDTVGSFSLRLENEFSVIAVPNNITLTRVVTSRFEELDINEDLTKITDAISGHTVWVYTPDVAPENLTLTYTFVVS